MVWNLLFTLGGYTPLRFHGGAVDWFVKGGLALLGKIAGFLVEGLTALIKGCIEIMTYTPAPKGADGNIFAKPTEGAGIWKGMYTYYHDQMIPIALTLLGIMIILAFALGAFSPVINSYDMSRLMSRLVVAFFGIYLSWYMASFLLNFADGLAMTINPSADEIQDLIKSFQGIIAVSGTYAVLLIITSVIGSPILLGVFAMYTVRVYAIFSIVISLPVLWILWAVNIGPFEQVSHLSKKAMKSLIPIAFMTVPNAVFIRVSYIIMDSATLAPSEMMNMGVAESAAGVVTLVGAMVLPILAIAAPMFLFDFANQAFSAGAAAGSKIGGVVNDLEEDADENEEASEDEEEDAREQAQTTSSSVSTSDTGYFDNISSTVSDWTGDRKTDYDVDHTESFSGNRARNRVNAIRNMMEGGKNAASAGAGAVGTGLHRAKEEAGIQAEYAEWAARDFASYSKERVGELAETVGEVKESALDEAAWRADNAYLAASSAVEGARSSYRQNAEYVQQWAESAQETFNEFTVGDGSPQSRARDSGRTSPMEFGSNAGDFYGAGDGYNENADYRTNPNPEPDNKPTPEID